MNYRFTAAEASEAARLGRLEEWIHAFLQAEGGNPAFSEGLRREPRHFLAPVPWPLGAVSRCCGPEAGMKYPVSAESFELRVGRILGRLRGGWDMPPLMINYHAGEYELNDGNHRHEALRRAGAAAHPAIIWLTGDADLAGFLAVHGGLYPARA
jgi:hypothetical protein